MRLMLVCVAVLSCLASCLLVHTGDENIGSQRVEKIAQRVLVNARNPRIRVTVGKFLRDRTPRKVGLREFERLAHYDLSIFTLRERILLLHAQRKRLEEIDETGYEDMACRD